MHRAKILFQLSLADFRERIRKYSFLVVMLGVMFFGYLVITGQYTIQFGNLKNVYNSAWAGTAMAVCSSIMMAIVGFYVIRGSIKRDRVTGVGQIIASTQMSGSVYIFSKILSNIAALLIMIMSLFVLALITLLFRNESGSIDLWAFTSPFIIVSVPVAIFVASIATLFDAARWLRGSIGNIVYLFFAESCIIMGILAVPFLDLASVAVFTESARAAALAAFPGEKVEMLMGFVALDPGLHFEAVKTVLWTGISWTNDMLIWRVHWIVIAGLVSGMSVLIFDRFDSTRNRSTRLHRKPKKTTPETVREKSANGVAPAYDSLCRPKPCFSLAGMVRAELRLMLARFHWFWYVVALGLIGAQLVVPFSIARMFLIPASMVWPLVIWSSMGTRDSGFSTAQLLLSSPGPIRRQFPSVYLAGLLISVASITFMLIRSVLAGEWSYAAMLLLAALLVPSVSLAMGTLSGSRKLFEVTYLMIWYIGSIDRLTPVDFLGTTSASISAAKFAILSLITVGSLVLALFARNRQVSYR